MRLTAIAAAAIALVGVSNAAAEETWAYCHVERARCTPRGASACDDPQYLWQVTRFFVPPFPTRDTSRAQDDAVARERVGNVN
jgi:hypothetical protein